MSVLLSKVEDNGTRGRHIGVVRDTTTIVGRSSRDVVEVAAGQPGEQTAEAVAYNADFSALRCSVDGGLQVRECLIHVKLLKSQLDTGIHIVFCVSQLNIALQAVKNGRRNGVKACFSITIDD